MDDHTTCISGSMSAGKTGHSIPSPVLIIPKADITAKLSVFLPPVFRSPESTRRDRIRCSPDLWPFSYPGSCPSLSGDRLLAFNKTTLWTNNTYHRCLGLGFPFRKWESKEDAEKHEGRKERGKGERGTFDFSEMLKGKLESVEKMRDGGRDGIPSW